MADGIASQRALRKKKKEKKKKEKCRASRAPARVSAGVYSYKFQYTVSGASQTAAGRVRAELRYSTGVLNRVRATFYHEHYAGGKWVATDPANSPGFMMRVDQLYSDAEPRCRAHQTTWETNIVSTGQINRQMYVATRDLHSLYMRATVSVKPDSASRWVDNAIRLLELRTP